MNTVNLIIGEKTFKLGFGLGLFRILGKKWNLPGINEVVLKMAILDSISENPSFEVLDCLEAIILAAIEMGEGPGVDLSNVQVLDEFFRDPQLLEDFKNSLISSLPQNNQPPNEGK